MATIRRPSKAELPPMFGTKANRGRRGYPQARTIRNALNALQRMPPEAVADLVERLVDRLDAEEPDLDIEDDNQDCCPAGDDNPQLSGSLNGSGWLCGDADDAEVDDEGEDDGDNTRGPDLGQRLSLGDAEDAEPNGDDEPNGDEREPDDDDMGADDPFPPIDMSEPSVQIGTVPSHVHGVDGVWVAVR